MSGERYEGCFLTVFLNHHQVPLCLALAKYADEFTLIPHAGAAGKGGEPGLS